MSGSRFAHRRVRPLVAPLLALVLAGGLLPAPSAARAVDPVEASVPAAAAALPAASAADVAPARGSHPVADDRTADATAAPDEAPEAGPSIAYEEAMAHEADRIDFTPGGRVSVGFAPRADDRWPIDGRAPGALPAGRASGRQMAASANGSAWADITTTAGGPSGAAGVGAGTTGSGTTGDAPAIPPDEAATADPAATGDPAASPGTAEPAPTPTPADPVDPGATAVPSDAPVDAPARAVAAQARPASAAASTDPAFDMAAASGLRRQVFGFLPYWEVSGAATKLNYDVLSTIAYFSVGSTSAGNLKKKDADGTLTTGWGGWTSSSMTSVINAAHQRGTRVVLTISVFAWTSAQATAQKGLLGSSTARANLAKQVAAAVRDRGADGVNLDFEPLSAGYEDEFVSLVKSIRSQLNAIKAGYQLTYDTMGSIGNYPLEASLGTGAADAVFIMGYDYRTASSATAGSIDPLSGPKYDLADTVRAYTARIPASRVLLGLPWYGRAWSTTAETVRSANQSGTKYGSSTAVTYENIPDLVAQYGRRWDSTEQSPYIAYQRQNCTSTYGCVTSWRQVYYDDEASIKLRLGLVNDYGLRGAGTWALGYDGGHPELYCAFADSFLVDKSAPQAGISLLSTYALDEGFVVTWSASDTSAVVSYDVQVSVAGGAWAPWLDATTATSDVWLGRDGTGYAFRVRARDSRGNTGTWNVTSTWEASPALERGGFARVAVDSIAYRAGPDTASARLGTLARNTIMAITSNPVSADGYTWYEVTQPIAEWNPVTFVERGVWVAASSATATYITPFRAPNSITVDAGLKGMDFGPAGTALGPDAETTGGRLLSPNADGRSDTLRLRWTNALAMETLELRAYRPDGTLVGSVPVPVLTAGAHAWDWTGAVSGATLPDGRYVLQLVGTAGGRTYYAPSRRPATPAQLAAYAVTVDTTPPPVTAAGATTTLLSPDGDGYRDATRLTLTATGAVRWTAQVADGAGTVLAAGNGTGATATLDWAGTDAVGAPVPDGTYTATLVAYDLAGNASTRTTALTVDTTAPVVSASAGLPIFSPNGDGAADTTRLAWTAPEPVSGTVRVEHGTTVVRSWTVTARTAWAATWTGRRDDGTGVPDGTYTVRVRLRDAAGNAGTATAVVVVDRTAGFLRWSGAFHPQDADALRPTATLSWRQVRTATSTLRLYDASGALVRTVWSGRALAAGTRSWTWNGRLADGTWAPQGRYTARLAVTSPLGTQELARTVWAAAFVPVVSPSVVGPGTRLTIRFTTVEPLATRPTVTFSRPGFAAVTVTATRLSDGSYRAVFTVGSGAAGVGRLRIAARDAGGHTNAMAVPVTIGGS